MSNYIYPNLIKRVHSFCIDYTILFLMLLLFPIIISSFPLNGVIKFIFSVIIPVLLEPLFISIRGSSIGQKYHGLKVISEKTGMKINIFKSILRSLLFIPMGVFSIVTIFTTREYQALHDILSGAVVVVDDKDKVLDCYCLPERITADQLYDYPSKIRRSVFVVIYIFLSILIIGFIDSCVISSNCSLYKQCKSSEIIFNFLLSLIMVVLLMLIIILGCNSKLFGARRSEKNAA